MGTDIEKLVDLMIQERMQSQFAKWREAETGKEKKADYLRLETEYEKAISALSEEQKDAVRHYCDSIFDSGAESESSAVAYALNQLDDELGGGWSCDTSTLSIPAFMVAGTGSADAGNVEENRLELAEGETQGICPLWWLRECFDTMPDAVPKVIGRLSGKDHGDIPFSADGYMTAWFMYWLQGDEAAGEAFFGADAEIGVNENWQDVTINFP